MTPDVPSSWENDLQVVAQRFPYPPTPEIAPVVRRRLEWAPAAPRRLSMAWAVALVVVALAALLAVPTVRAQLIQFLQIGGVQIFLATSTPQPPPTAAPAGTVSPTPAPTPTLVGSVFDIAGETTLEQARQQVSFPIRLPAYPADLGEPDHTYVMDLNGPVLFLVWVEPENPREPRLALQQFQEGTTTAQKWDPHQVQATEVNGQPAAWTTGEYLLEMRSGDLRMRRMIEGHVLVWSEGEITYRLETGLSMEEAIRIAESLE